MDIKTKIRTATIGKKKFFKRKVVEVSGVEIEIRQPNKIIKQQIVERSKESTSGSTEMGINILEWQIWHIIECCFVPGTEERVFEEADIPGFKSGPEGDFADKLWLELQELVSTEKDVEKAKKS